MKRNKIVQLTNRYVMFVLYCVAILPFSGCNKSGQSVVPLPFDSIPVSRTIVPLVGEISGIADSKINPGYIWGEEDSGNPPQLRLISHDGSLAKNIYIKNVSNRDWE